MGSWSLLSLSGNSDQYDTAELFGHRFTVWLTLKYTATTFGAWTDSPIMEWNESFQVKDLTDSTWWRFPVNGSVNMYAHKPTSPTMLPWPSRYGWAWDHARYGTDNGCILRDVAGRDVPFTRISPNANGAPSSREKIDAIQNYLKRHSGQLLVRIRDIPSLQRITRTGKARKARLLRFDVGLAVEGGQRLRAEQYLEMDETRPPNEWTREFRLYHNRQLDVAGCRETAAPDNVSQAQPVVLTKDSGYVP